MNAAILAVQSLAVARPSLARQLAAYKRAVKKKVMDGDARVQADLGKRRA